MIAIRRAMALSVVFGMATFSMTIALAVAGNPLNPYVAWTILWGACNLMLIWRIARLECYEQVGGGQG